LVAFLNKDVVRVTVGGDELSANQDSLKEMADFLHLKMDQLKKIENEEFKNKPSKEELARISTIIVKEIEDIEIKEKRLSKKFVKMNEELESLKKEEDLIYNVLKVRYPKFTDEQIKQEIQKYLDE
jgi:transcriptional regulator with XRE-family HTH domain